MLMKTSTRVSGTRARGTATEYSPREMVIISKVTGLLIWEKARDPISIMIKTSFLLENGSMISLKPESILRSRMMKSKRCRRNPFSQILTFFLLFLNSNLLIPQKYLKEQWKEPREKEQSSELNISLLRRCSPRLKFLISDRHLNLLLDLGNHL